MSRVTDQYVVCDQCGGSIPDAADCIKGVNGVLVLSGAQIGFANLDFCCSAHLGAWVGAQPTVPTPDPPYSPPPAGA